MIFMTHSPKLPETFAAPQYSGNPRVSRFS
ncbi:hypothetical protein F383_01315 [Gossypium arboreum]|uniref:Uncharacterized protein n=1 Tax=Gossypium arboreum TaxID=29729 RepID=A0A0B0PTY9_GOSAR|nr:hypothetical protein F383_01315 [Gossypium arboreum]